MELGGADEDLGNEERQDEDQDGGVDHGLRGGAADALGSTGSAEAPVAAYERHHEREDEGLQKALHHVAPFQGLPGGGPILAAGQVVDEVTDHEAAEHAHEI